MRTTVESAVARFGDAVKAKLSSPPASGQPEDQLRAPFEALLQDFAAIANLPEGSVTAVGEPPIAGLHSRPDFAITVRNALAGYIELKAPGKGADPRKFRDPHDKAQWERLQALPNLLYTDGNSISLWQNGELAGEVLVFGGDIALAGSKLQPPPGLALLFESFLRWKPIPPGSAKELAQTTARLCRLLRAEVNEQLALGSPALTSLAKDWRKLLFPDASDDRFADGYAQAVTFGLLMARAKGIALQAGLNQVAEKLSQSSSLIGAALRLLTDSAENQSILKTSLGTLTRVLDAVVWSKVSQGEPDAWLYFYEHFLEVYDNDLRKKTGSYYTPPEVVGAMVGLVDEALRSRFALHAGLASPQVTLADPATGTGTFVLGVLRQIAASIRADQGDGAVPAALHAALRRLIAFEMQLGPFAVAQLRILAEVVELAGGPPSFPPRMYVTDTLANPNDDEEWIPGILAPIANSRRDANKIKRDETITVVLGNPPYKEKAKGMGGWIEQSSKNEKTPPPLQTWMPPPEWGAGAHSKHLHNLYVYFWRWATWKVFDHGPGNRSGVVCFITVAGFLHGPGFQRMRAYLREICDDIWVIDCSPEGHQPEVPTRIFQGVQQPVCIVLASRSDPKRSGPTPKPAAVHFRALPEGSRGDKFNALARLHLTSPGWTTCPSDPRAPFLPASKRAWSSYPALEALFTYNGSGVMPGRTWVIAPDPDSLLRRWQALTRAQADQKETFFHPHLLNQKPGDRHIGKMLKDGLPGFPPPSVTIADERGPCLRPHPYGFRSFDRQWIIPDNRLINRPNPTLWAAYSNQQIYLTAVNRTAPTNGPALTFTALIPDLDHYAGRGGRAFPLWQDAGAKAPNPRPDILARLTQSLGQPVSPADLMAYLAAVAAHPAFLLHFREDLSTPGLRIPITRDPALFARALDLGRTVIWLHTFGERMADPKHGRPAQPPRLPAARRPTIPKGGAIPQDPARMPNDLVYDPGQHRLLVGQGFVENVTPAMWSYEVSGKRILTQWFSYRKQNRERPIMGDRRRPSPLGDIQPDHWLPEYTAELLNLLNVLGWLVDLEPSQADLLEQICAGPLFSHHDLAAAAAPQPAARKRRQPRAHAAIAGLFDD